MDTARELSALAAHVDWPATPELRLSLEPRARGRHRRTLVAVLACAAILALAAAFAVPQSRGAILRLLHLGGVTIERVDTLPPAADRPLSVGIGVRITRDRAEATLGRRLLVPTGASPPGFYLHAGPVVSMLLIHEGGPVLLSEFAFGGGFLKKLAAGGTSTEPGGMTGGPSIWISGSRHDVFFPGVSARLAGNVLLWERDGATYRLEGRSLTRVDAVALARSLTRG